MRREQVIQYPSENCVFISVLNLFVAQKEPQSKSNDIFEVARIILFIIKLGGGARFFPF